MTVKLESLRKEDYEALPEVIGARKLEKEYRIRNVEEEINIRINELRKLYYELGELKG